MNLDRLIAQRYIISRKGISLVSTLTFISIGGVTIGTALLIIVLSVFNGFYELIKGLLLDFDPDIRITQIDNRSVLIDSETDSFLRAIPEISFISPYIEGKCLLTTGNNSNRVITVRGIDPQHYYPHKNHNILTSGIFDLDIDAGKPGILVSESLVNELRLYLDDSIQLISADGVVKSMTQFSGPRSFRLEVRGFFTFNELLRDELALIDLRLAKRLFYTRGGVSGIDIKLADPESASDVAAKISKKMGPDYLVETWYDLKKPLYDVMQLEKWASYFILMIIVGVAVLNIIGSLTMIVLQKKREIGMLMAIGFTQKRIQRIFQIQGLIIGLLGCVFGGGLGIGLSYLQQKYGLIKLAGSESFIIDAYPVIISSNDILIVLLGSLFLCISASFIPAKHSSTIDPALSLRNE